jgi:putative tryptophan/tyrosine transport system substrate-binding protein
MSRENLVIELRYAETPVLLVQHADELTRLGVDVVVGTATPAALALKRATRTLPIVMGTASDPVQAGLVESLARPGGNITGSAVLFPEVTAKQMELLKEAHVKASRILVIGNWSNPAIQRIWNTLPPPAQRLNVRFALSHRLTSISFYREFPESGGLMSYGPSLVELVRRSAWYVDKILKGAKPSDLPVEQPTKFDLVINLKTAKTLGLTIPKSVLVRAGEIIQ